MFFSLKVNIELSSKEIWIRISFLEINGLASLNKIKYIDTYQSSLNPMLPTSSGSKTLTVIPGVCKNTPGG